MTAKKSLVIYRKLNYRITNLLSYHCLLVFYLYRYVAICPSAQPLHVSSWIERHLPSSVRLQDVTSQYCVLAVMGPHSRHLLESLTRTPFDNKSFPFATAQVNKHCYQQTQCKKIMEIKICICMYTSNTYYYFPQSLMY